MGGIAGRTQAEPQTFARVDPLPRGLKGNLDRLTGSCCSAGYPLVALAEVEDATGPHHGQHGTEVKTGGGTAALDGDLSLAKNDPILGEAVAGVGGDIAPIVQIRAIEAATG